MTLNIFLSILTVTGINLHELDKAVADYQVYENSRLQSIENCKAKIKGSTAEELPDVYNEIFNLYFGFQGDSALVYAHKSIEQCRRNSDRVKEQTALLNLANIYQITGSNYESLEILDSIVPEYLPDSHLIHLYSIYNTIYSALETISSDKKLKEEYADQSLRYKKLILKMDPGQIYVRCDTLILAGKAEEAMSVIRPVYESTPEGDPSMGIVAYIMGDLSGRLGNKKDEKDFYTISAYHDIRNGNKEYLSLIKLAKILYGEGDFTRAYNYLNRSMIDASYSGAAVRIEEIAPILPIINDTYNKTMKKKQLSLTIALVLLVVSILITLFLIMNLRKQKAALSDYNRKIVHANRLQERANKDLREVSNIKNLYITQLMLECIRRIENLEEYKKDLRRKALKGELDELKKELRSNEIIEAQWKSFYNVFDTTFLSIFPAFIQSFNTLLKEENRVREDGRLTAELRIYAMIRLGIDSTEKIASLLRYSKATIYSYRSRTRLKAYNPATFEDDIKKIKSI